MVGFAYIQVTANVEGHWDVHMEVDITVIEEGGARNGRSGWC
jgi:hypothetical protein